MSFMHGIVGVSLLPVAMGLAGCQRFSPAQDTGALVDTDAVTTLAPRPHGDRIAPSMPRIDATAPDEVLAEYDPVAIQLHLHGSISEHNGTMAFHQAQAEQYGIDVLYWSDHDVAVMMDLRRELFDFDDQGLMVTWEEDGREMSCGFQLANKDHPHDSTFHARHANPEDFYWQVAESGGEAGEWREIIYDYRCDPWYLFQLPLLAQGGLQFNLRPHNEVSQDWQLRIELGLSGNFDGTQNKLVYHLGASGTSVQDTADTHYIPLRASPGEWSTYDLKVYEDAAHFTEGLDQGLHNFRIKLRTSSDEPVGFDLDQWRLKWDVSGQELLYRQATFLDEHFGDGDVVHFVGQEITRTIEANHVTAMGPAIPLYEYEGTSSIPREKAVDYVQSHGGVAVCAHPFGVASRTLREELAAKRLDREARLWTENGAFGCDAMEVGYTNRGVDLAHHLALWDQVSNACNFVTGVGSTDNHWTRDWNDLQNTHVSWLLIEEPTHGEILDAVERGRLFFGDPRPFVGEEPRLDLWLDSGAAMGQVHRSDESQTLHVVLGHTRPGWRLVLRVNGEVQDWVVLTGEEEEIVFELDAVDECTAVRVELRVANDNDAILLSNPIYLVPMDVDVSVPVGRRVY